MPTRTERDSRFRELDELIPAEHRHRWMGNGNYRRGLFRQRCRCGASRIVLPCGRKAPSGKTGRPPGGEHGRFFTKRRAAALSIKPWLKRRSA